MNSMSSADSAFPAYHWRWQRVERQQRLAQRHGRSRVPVLIPLSMAIRIPWRSKGKGATSVACTAHLSRDSRRAAAALFHHREVLAASRFGEPVQAARSAMAPIRHGAHTRGARSAITSAMCPPRAPSSRRASRPRALLLRVVDAVQHVFDREIGSACLRVVVHSAEIRRQKRPASRWHSPTASATPRWSCSRLTNCAGTPGAEHANLVRAAAPGGTYSRAGCWPVLELLIRTSRQAPRRGLGPQPQPSRENGGKKEPYTNPRRRLP